MYYVKNSVFVVLEDFRSQSVCLIIRDKGKCIHFCSSVKTLIKNENVTLRQ